MTITRGNLPKSLVPGVHEFVGLSYGETPQEHLPLYEVLKSNRAFEEEVMLSGMGGAPTKAEGSAVKFDDIHETYTSRYQHETIAVGFAVTKEAFDDDLYDNIARAKSQELGRSMADTKQVKAAALFNRGFDYTQLGGDGEPLFSTQHPTAGGTFSNKMSADLSETALEDATIAISKMTNDRGILISARAMMLVVPPELEYVAYKILNADMSTGLGIGGFTNKNTTDPNALKAMGRFPGGVVVNRRLTDPDAWFIKTSIPNGTKMFVREALSGSEETDFVTDNMLFKFRERYTFGWTDPRQWLGSEGA